MNTMINIVYLFVIGAILYNLVQNSDHMDEEKLLLLDPHQTSTNNNEYLSDVIQTIINTKDLLLSKMHNSKMLIVPSTKSNEVSYKQICKQFIQGQNKDNRKTLIQENKKLCRNEKSYESLTQIFISAYLSNSIITNAMNNWNGVPIVYEHNCNQWGITCGLDKPTIQGSLPASLIIKNINNTDNMIELCNTIINDSWGTNEILKSNNDYIWNIILPWISDNFHSMLQSNIIKKKSAIKTQIAMIYLSCLEEDDDENTCQSYALPLYLYPLLIPTSITYIDISCTPTCANNNDCYDHANNLHSFIKHMFPRAKITLKTQISTHQTYLEILNADYFLAPPSQSSLLPALSRNKHKKKQTILVMHSIYDYLFPNVLSVKCCTVLPFSYVKSTNTQDLMHHLRLFPIKPKYCPIIRSKVGSWVQDMALAPLLQYDRKLHHYFGLAQYNFTSLEYRSPTTFKWVDDWSPQCPSINPITKELFCQTMLQQNISRIMFLGDYTALNQAISLVMMLDNTYKVKDDSNWSLDMFCNKYNKTSIFTIEFIRNEKMIENNEPIIPDQRPNCDDRYCYPWKERYLSKNNHHHKNKKTILIINFGLHMSTVTEYKQALLRFLKHDMKIISKDDYVFVRESVPGHDSCNVATKPFDNYTHYNSSIPRQHAVSRWDVLPVYNNMLHYYLYHSKKYTDKYVSSLDVHDMTVLRPDGHISGIDCNNCDNVQDCLHYSLPGVVDWWNLLFFQNFVDLNNAVTPIYFA